jgi:hypothetical protein
MKSDSGSSYIWCKGQVSTKKVYRHQLRSSSTARKTPSTAFSWHAIWASLESDSKQDWMHSPCASKVTLECPACQQEAVAQVFLGVQLKWSNLHGNNCPIWCIYLCLMWIIKLIEKLMVDQITQLSIHILRFPKPKDWRWSFPNQKTEGEGGCVDSESDIPYKFQRPHELNY